MAKSTSRKLHEKGVSLFRKEKYEEALEKLNEALQESDVAKMSAEIYNDIGVVYRQLENYPAAYQALDEAQTTFLEVEDKKGQAQTIGNRASVLEAEGLIEEAVESYKESARLMEEIGEGEMAMYAWQAISRLRTKQGQYIAAIGAYEEGVENMPNSMKKKVLKKILGMPGALLGTAGQLPAQDDDEDEEKK